MSSKPQRCVFSLTYLWCLRLSVCVIQVAARLRPGSGTAATWPAEKILPVSSRTKTPLQIVSVIQKTVSALDQTLTDTSIPQGQGLESAHQRHLLSGDQIYQTHGEALLL